VLVGESFIDVGTGGGLPGIPLAIRFPQKHFTLLDSAGKKTRFLFQVKQELGLDNVSVENRRVEQFTPNPKFDGVISRAFASLPDMVESCAHLLNEGGRFWAMKGQIPVDELREIEASYILEHCHSLQVPGVEAQRCLLVMKPITAQSNGG
jgi:16S rRNA (guanine527-N7)-methyltransferase